MNIVVCIKRVPDTGETQLNIAEDSLGIRRDKLVYDINEADNYALEEALLIRAKQGGSVTVVTVGDEASNEQLRTCLAKGADAAVRFFDSRLTALDGYATAKILHALLVPLAPDMVLTGCVSNDVAAGQVGVQLAQMLHFPHATLVTKVDIGDSSAKVRSELENGLAMMLELKLPALIAVQTGINEPRYASFRGIKEAYKREIKVVDLAALSLDMDGLANGVAQVKLEKLFVPRSDKTAQVLSGSAEETAAQLTKILVDRGLV